MNSLNRDHVIFTDAEIADFVKYRYLRHEKITHGVTDGYSDVYTVHFKKTEITKANWFRMNDEVKETVFTEEFRFHWRRAVENGERRFYQREESIAFRNYLNGLILFKNKDSQLYEKFEQFLSGLKNEDSVE